MNTSVNNSTAKFLESFIKLGEFFGAALDNYLNENYNDVDSKEDDGIEEPTDCCCGKGCDCCEDCSNSEEKTPGVPASSTIKCDEYTLIISDYVVVQGFTHYLHLDVLIVHISMHTGSNLPDLRHSYLSILLKFLIILDMCSYKHLYLLIYQHLKVS